jgi:hypothetical protein
MPKYTTKIKLGPDSEICHMQQRLQEGTEKNLWIGLVASQQTYLIKEEILNEEEVDKGKAITTCRF